jgi:hypothetical protein
MNRRHDDPQPLSDRDRRRLERFAAAHPRLCDVSTAMRSPENGWIEGLRVTDGPPCDLIGNRTVAQVEEMVLAVEAAHPVSS